MSITLPQVRAGASEPSTSPQRTKRIETVERLTRILLVEDEPLTAEVFAQALTRDGHQVEVARDGLQALRRLRDRVPSVIILDMNLPTLPGTEVVRRLRAAGHRQVPILVVSGSCPSLAQLGRDELAPGKWLEKPVKPRDLVREVRRLLPETMA
ncbi:MAG: response regulator [Planctomycetes bacterium]|nr:response regulator [Planctomycetota bacterium]